MKKEKVVYEQKYSNKNNPLYPDKIESNVGSIFLTIIFVIIAIILVTVILSTYAGTAPYGMMSAY